MIRGEFIVDVAPFSYVFFAGLRANSTIFLVMFVTCLVGRWF